MVSPLLKYCPFEPTERQRLFLQSDAYDVLYGGAAGGAKSVGLLMAALQYVHVPGYRGILFRRTYADLALPEALMDLAHQWLDRTDAVWHDNAKTFTFPAGSSLSFGYLDGPRDHLRYKGAAFQFVGMDELTEFAPHQVLYMHSRIRRDLARARIPLRFRAATNPGGIGHEWVYDRYIMNPGDRVFIRSLLTDNPHLDQASYLRSLAELDPVTRAQLERGEWVRDSDELVYRLGDALIGEPPELEHHGLGVDLGWHDETAITVLGWRAYDPAVYVVRSEKHSGMTVSRLAERVRTLCAEYHPEFMVADQGGGGKQIVEEMRIEHSLPFVAAEKTDKVGYIKLINSEFQHARLLVCEPACGPLLDELRAHRWKDASHQHEHPASPNHCCDSMLYAWRRARKIHTGAQPDGPPPRDPTPEDPNYGEWAIKQRATVRDDAWS